MKRLNSDSNMKNPLIFVANLIQLNSRLFPPQLTPPLAWTSKREKKHVHQLFFSPQDEWNQFNQKENFSSLVSINLFFDEHLMMFHISWLHWDDVMTWSLHWWLIFLAITREGKKKYFCLLTIIMPWSGMIEYYKSSSTLEVSTRKEIWPISSFLWFFFAFKV